MRNLFLLFALIALSFSAVAQHGPVIPMDSLQFVDDSSLALGNTDPKYVKYNDTFTIVGVVTFNPWLYGMSENRKATWLQAESLKPWSAMNVFIDHKSADIPNWTYPPNDLAQLNKDTKFYENFVPGYKVKCTGILTQFSSNTQLNLIPIETEIIDLGPINIAPLVLTIDTFMKYPGGGADQIPQHVSGEKYEGMYVQFNNVTVVDVSSGPARYYWYVIDKAGNKIQIRDVSGYYRNDGNNDSDLTSYTFTPLPIGTKLDFLKGIIVFYNGQYMLAPLKPSDIKEAFAPAIKNFKRKPFVPKPLDNVKISATITDKDGVVVEAFLYYAIGLTDTNFNQLPMMRDMDTFFSDLPPYPNNQYVRYYISAMDNDSNIAEFPNRTSAFIYQVLDNGITSIRDIQNTPLSSGNSIWQGDTIANISIGGIVTATVDQLGMVVIQDGTQPFSGIFLRSTLGDGLIDLDLGDSIVITSAAVEEDNGLTRLLNTGNGNHQVISTGNTLPAPIKNLSPDSINAKVYKFSEAYEGMLLEFDSIYMIGNPDAPSYYGEWAMNYDSAKATGLRADDVSSHFGADYGRDSLIDNQLIIFIKGILHYSFSNFKLLPRDKSDIKAFRIPVADFEQDQTSGQFPLSVQFTDKSYQSPAFWNWKFTGGTPSVSTDRNPNITYNDIGVYPVTLIVSNEFGSDTLEVDSLIFCLGVGISQPNSLLQGLSLYPNPANSIISIRGFSNTQDEIIVNIFDQTGRKMNTLKEVISGDISIELDIDEYNEGLYLVEIISSDNSKIVKMFTKTE